MNRADLVRSALVWEQVAAEARRRAGEAREQLAADARAELSEQGTAPTWRMPDLATVTLPVSKESVTLADIDALTKWAAERYPSEVEMVAQIRPAWIAAIPQWTTVEGDVVCDAATGEIVPGLAVRPGGQPGALTIRASTAAKAVLAAGVEDIVAAVAGALSEPHDERPDGA